MNFVVIKEKYSVTQSKDTTRTPKTAKTDPNEQVNQLDNPIRLDYSKWDEVYRKRRILFVCPDRTVSIAV